MMVKSLVVFFFIMTLINVPVIYLFNTGLNLEVPTLNSTVNLNAKLANASVSLDVFAQFSLGNLKKLNEKSIKI